MERGTEKLSHKRTWLLGVQLSLEKSFLTKLKWNIIKNMGHLIRSKTTVTPQDIKIACRKASWFLYKL
ncbi:hypothetical protein CEH05_14380 [Halobacillus halophilus]|nr:hypothetical protein CEH05_14380 [Halobacillus halophilus]